MQGYTYCRSWETEILTADDKKQYTAFSRINAQSITIFRTPATKWYYACGIMWYDACVTWSENPNIKTKTTGQKPMSTECSLAGIYLNLLVCHYQITENDMSSIYNSLQQTLFWAYIWKNSEFKKERKTENVLFPWL
jgi:hypothetical protein